MRRNTALSVVASVLIVIYVFTYLASDTYVLPSIPECKMFVISVINFFRNLISW